MTALRAEGVEVGNQVPLQLVTTHPHPVRRKDIKITRVAKLPPSGDHFCRPDHCFASACADLSLLEAVTAGDWLVRLKLATPAGLNDYAAEYRGRGARLARRAAGMVRNKVDSPRESKLRLCLTLAGLPEPEVNPKIGSRTEEIGHFDLVYFGYKIAIEYDGDHHRTDRKQWDTDIWRHEAAAKAGWHLIRITNQRMKWPRQVVLGIYERLLANGYGGPEPVFSDEWSELFERTVR